LKGIHFAYRIYLILRFSGGEQFGNDGARRDAIDRYSFWTEFFGELTGN
jgi:hypothetical protein